VFWSRLVNVGYIAIFYFTFAALRKASCNLLPSKLGCKTRFCHRRPNRYLKSRHAESKRSKSEFYAQKGALEGWQVNPWRTNPEFPLTPW
jgi:hypothetical protein